MIIFELFQQSEARSATNFGICWNSGGELRENANDIRRRRPGSQRLSARSRRSASEAAYGSFRALALETCRIKAAHQLLLWTRNAATEVALLHWSRRSPLSETRSAATRLRGVLTPMRSAPATHPEPNFLDARMRIERNAAISTRVTRRVLRVQVEYRFDSKFRCELRSRGCRFFGFRVSWVLVELWMLGFCCVF